MLLSWLVGPHHHDAAARQARLHRTGDIGRHLQRRRGQRRFARDREIRFLQAGGDMVLIINRADLLPMLTGVQGEAASSPAFCATLRQAAQDVVMSKIQLGLVPCSR
jgi:hypothetical protein